MCSSDLALERFESVRFGEWQGLGGGTRFRFTRAGHILGSGMVRLDLGAGALRRFLFTGDVGRPAAPLVQDPEPPEACDVLVIESTYGDRRHPPQPVEEELAALLERVIGTGGVLLIPAFAVGRSQQLLVWLHAIMRRRRELALPMHLDSPMAVDTTAIYRRYPEERGLEVLDLQSGDSVVYGRNVYLHRTRDDSIRLNALGGPRVIISSSGMLSGGRGPPHPRPLLPPPQPPQPGRAPPGCRRPEPLRCRGAYDRISEPGHRVRRGCQPLPDGTGRCNGRQPKLHAVPVHRHPGH